jgi:hypothetical protein
MNSKFISVCVIAAAIAAPGLIAQTLSQTAPAASVAPSNQQPNQIIYSSKLPTAAELMNTATQGQTVEKIDQTASRVTVTYKFANGQTTTVAYEMLPGGSGGSYSASPAPTVVMPSTPAPAVTSNPTVVYPSDQQVVYYDGGYPYSYYPGYWYPPISLGFGFGFHGGGFHGGGFRGGFRR